MKHLPVLKVKHRDETQKRCHRNAFIFFSVGSVTGVGGESLRVALMLVVEKG